LLNLVHTPIITQHSNVHSNVNASCTRMHTYIADVAMDFLSRC